MPRKTPQTLIPLQFTLDDGGGFPSDGRPIDRLSFDFDTEFEDVVLVTSENVQVLCEEGLRDVGKLTLMVVDNPQIAERELHREHGLCDVTTARLENGYGLVAISEVDLDFSIVVEDQRTPLKDRRMEADAVQVTSVLSRNEVEDVRENPGHAAVGAERQVTRLIEEACAAGPEVRQALYDAVRDMELEADATQTYYFVCVNSWVDDVMRDGFPSDPVDGTTHGQALFTTLEAALSVREQGGEGRHGKPADFQVLAVETNEVLPRTERQIEFGDPVGGERVLKRFGQGEGENGIHWKPKRRVVGTDHVVEAEPFRTYYHVTHEADLQSILVEGFEGGHGDVGFGVYLFDDLEAAEDYIARGGWDGQTAPSDLEIIEVTCDELPSVEPHPEWKDPENYEHVVFKGMDEDDDEAVWLPERSHIFATMTPRVP